MSSQPFSVEEIARMREAVLGFDREHANNSFDLSKPVVKPYTLQPFPALVYDHKASEPAYDRDTGMTNPVTGVKILLHVPANLVSKTVNGQEELDAAIAEGWSPKPPTFSDPEPPAPKRSRFGKATA